MADLKALAERVDNAAHKATEIPQLSEAISIDEAYAIQKLSLARRYAAASARSASRWDSRAAPRWSRWACTT